jgi:hypothetical protein
VTKQIIISRDVQFNERVPFFPSSHVGKKEFYELPVMSELEEHSWESGKSL